MSTDVSTESTKLERFRDFVNDRIRAGEKELDPEDALELWRLSERAPRERAVDVAKIREAIDDMLAGDRGEPARDALRETCREFAVIDTTTSD